MDTKCTSVFEGYETKLKKDISSDTWIAELEKNKYQQIVISDRRTFSQDELKEWYNLIVDKEDTKTHRIVKIETNSWGGYKVFYKSSVSVDALTLEMDFTSWIEGEKNVVIVGNLVTGEKKIVVLNHETSQQLKNR